MHQPASAVGPAVDQSNCTAYAAMLSPKQIPAALGLLQMLLLAQAGAGEALQQTSTFVTGDAAATPPPCPLSTSKPAVPAVNGYCTSALGCIGAQGADTTRQLAVSVDCGDAKLNVSVAASHLSQLCDTTPACVAFSIISPEYAGCVLLSPLPLVTSYHTLISPCAKTGPGHRASCSASCIPKRLLRALKSTNGTSDKHFSPPNSILNSYKNDKLLPRIRWSVWQKTQPPKAGPWPYPPGHGPPAPAPPAKPIQPDLVHDAYNNM